ncbi:MAG: hydrogenase accessory protein HypB, partial [Spirochaetes bacterium]|nr:hydrogenase accessory protein HypB [Spirochaetota bacterium]
PAEFDIGEDAKIALMSTPEGDDKPGKYPLLFREAKLIILNKMDILPYTNFNKDAFLDDVKKLNGEIPVIETSCTNGTGIDSWINWLEKQKK